MRVELPDGGWVELYAPRKVRERARRRYIAAVADLNQAVQSLPQIANPDPDSDGPALIPDPAHFGSAQTALTDRLTDMLVLCLVKDWSLGPVDENTLEQLDAETFDVLARACRDLAPGLTPDVTSPDVDPKAATGGYTPPPPTSSTAAETSVTRSFATTS